MAQRLEAAGANGIVLFNRFYQPDFDLDALEVKPVVTLSHSSELLLRLHWAAMLHGQIHADIAITGGVHTAEDVVKSMMAGAKVTMLASALLQNGIGYLRPLRNQLEAWLENHEYESIEQMQGSMSHKNVPNPKAFQRFNYMRVLSSYVGK
jgi:dihydroorotate dehydrogenase (fumarate)